VRSWQAWCSDCCHALYRGLNKAAIAKRELHWLQQLEEVADDATMSVVEKQDRISDLLDTMAVSTSSLAAALHKSVTAKTS